MFARVCQWVSDRDDGFRVLMESIPSLTTIRPKPLKVGRCAGEMLTSLIQGEEPEDARLVMRGEPFIRESCGTRRASPIDGRSVSLILCLPYSSRLCCHRPCLNH